MTGYGFVGPMTAMGTVFDDKEESAAGDGQSPAASRYRYGFNLRYHVRLLFALIGG